MANFRADKFKWIFLIGLILISFYYLTENNNQQSHEESVPQKIMSKVDNVKTKIEKEIEKKARTAVENKLVSPPAPPTHEQMLRKWGFVDDPEDGQRMKKEIVENGKKKTIYAEKNNALTEPTQRTEKLAEETLASKRQLNPTDEIQELHPMNENNDDQSMLFATFRDDENEVESTFSISTDENGNYENEDFACLKSPKFHLNYEKTHGNYVIRADEIGYAVVKFDEETYLRVTWSMENGNRLAHQQLFKIENGQPVMKLAFKGKPVSRLKGDKIYWCN